MDLLKKYNVQNVYTMGEVREVEELLNKASKYSKEKESFIVSAKWDGFALTVNFWGLQSCEYVNLNSGNEIELDELEF